jgi:hypothetical protein
MSCSVNQVPLLCVGTYPVGNMSSGVKRLECEASYLPSLTAEIKDSWRLCTRDLVRWTWGRHFHSVAPTCTPGIEMAS